MIDGEIDICFNNHGELSKLLSNKKGMEKWAFKLMSRMEDSICNIIEKS